MTTISDDPFDKLIASLRNDGLTKEADLLHYMIHKVAWTTGSELIEELGQAVNKIKTNTTSLSENSKENIKEAMKIVKRVWPDFPE